MKPVILLVDDEEDLVSVLTDAIHLSMPGYEAVGSTSVEDAEKALANVSAGQLSLVCVDHRLGGRTGLEFLEEVRRRFPDVPSILFTGQASLSVEERAHQVGARVLWKPIRLSQWIGEVQAMLSSPATAA
ncbi:MAG: response regulator [Alphaproteobacteria bacterium]|nr:response regulator [Alphaproteobacteria bacterium]MCB9695229.1 response regulator [Alphaproteobacteria bacterium]